MRNEGEPFKQDVSSFVVLDMAVFGFLVSISFASSCTSVSSEFALKRVDAVKR